jgi:acetyl esterase/lipase
MPRDIMELPAPPADERIPYGPDTLQFGDLRRPSGPGPYPVAVAVHGGFWRARTPLDYLGHLCEALRAAGLATWSLEYRRIGHPGGGWPGTLLDVGRGLDHLRELAPRYNLDLSRVLTIGHSAGGHLALWLAGRHRIPSGDPAFTADPLPVQAAVSLAGVVDLHLCAELHLSSDIVLEFLGGRPDQVPERYATASPASLLPLGVRQVLIHGTADVNVPVVLSEMYHASALAKGDDVSLITLPDSDHFVVVDPRSAEWPTVLEATRSVFNR